MIYLMGYNARRTELFGDDIKAISKTIMAVTNSHHAHTEIRRKYTGLDGVAYDKSFSAEFGVGARIKNIKYSHDYRWDSLLLPYSPAQEAVAWEKALEMDGVEYDNIGVLGLATDFDIIKPDPKKIWCSKSNARMMFAADPRFQQFMANNGLDENINPSDLMTMAGYYYKKEKP